MFVPSVDSYIPKAAFHGYVLGYRNKVINHARRRLGVVMNESRGSRHRTGSHCGIIFYPSTGDLGTIALMGPFPKRDEPDQASTQQNQGGGFGNGGGGFVST